MDVKRLLVFGILGLFMISMMGGVLAVTGEEVGENVGGFIKGFANGITAFFKEAFSADSGISEFFFFVLLSMIIYTFVSSFFSASNTIRWIITLSISSLAIIGIPEGFLDSLLVSYGAMGLTILTIIPLLIVLVFSVKVKNLLLARATWIFYTIYYVALTINGLWKTGGAEGVYYVAAIIGGLMFLFVPYIRHMFESGTLEGQMEVAKKAIKKHSQAQKIRQESDTSVAEGL